MWDEDLMAVFRNIRSSFDLMSLQLTILIPATSDQRSPMATEGNSANEALPGDSLETTRELLKLGERPEGAKKPSRITKKGLVAANALLRYFAEEAQHRASIEAECDHEATLNHDETDRNEGIPIRADHITKVAAELIFDFST